MKHSQPVSRFTCFFQRDVALRNEVSATLRSISLLEIRADGTCRGRSLSTGAAKVGCPPIEESMQIENGTRKFKRPRAQIRTTSIFTVVFQFSIFNFQFEVPCVVAAPFICGSHPTTALPVPMTVQYPNTSPG